MEAKPMKILIIEDDINDCNNFINCVKNRNDVEIVAITDSDIDGLRYAKTLRPEGIVLDLELNNSSSGNVDSLDFVTDLQALNLEYMPIVIVTTHVNSKRTYDILHRKGVDFILYKDHPKYSANLVLNHFISMRQAENVQSTQKNVEEVLKGKQYIHDAILYLIENDNDNSNLIAYLSKIHKKSATTITNGIQNAIFHAWRITPVEDLTKHYTARVNYETGVPTPMEFIYYYKDKIKMMI